MRVAVLGAGVVGVATAFALLRDGHDVMLIDKADMVGAGATSGNAGLLTVGDSTVWASPATLRTIPRVLLGQSDSLKIEPRWGRELFRWGSRFLGECAPSRNRRNVVATHALSRFSLDQFRALLQSEDLTFDQVAGGLLVLFDDRRQLHAAQKARSLLARAGEEFKVLDQDALIALEPAYARSQAIPAWALHSPDDVSGDALAFTKALFARCQTSGLETKFGASVSHFSRRPDGLTTLHTSEGEVRADRYVICLAHGAPSVAASAGDRLNMLPATGFSLTAPILDLDAVPTLPAIDEARHVAFSRMGQRLRVTSSAVVGSAAAHPTDQDMQPILAGVQSLFPGAIDVSTGVRMARARPVMARNRPAIGRGKDPHVYYNTGHGALGWTQAWGSALLLAALINKGVPPIDPAPYAI